MRNSKLISIMAVAITSASLLVGCNESDTGSKENTNDKAQVEENLVEEKSEEKVEENLVDASNMVVESGDNIVEITGVEVVKDYDGNDALIVKYNYTNKGEEPTSAIMETVFQAFQNGKEIESCAFIENNEYNSQKDVMKDITMEDCWGTFVLEGEDEVTLFVSADWLSSNSTEYKINLVDKTITKVK